MKRAARPRVSDQASLERGYRRLLACYPRAFRRESGEEILAVLLDCAQDGQRRPDLATAVDLIKGAVVFRLRPAPRLPRAMRAAIRLMYLGVLAHLTILITVIITAGSVRSAVARGYPGLAAAQHAVNINLAIDYVGAPIGLAAWLVLTWALIRGRRWPRPALVVFLGVMTVSVLVAVGQGSAVYAPADLIAGVVSWLIALAATALLFTGGSNRYYHPNPRPATEWHGTFGTA